MKTSLSVGPAASRQEQQSQDQEPVHGRHPGQRTETQSEISISSMEAQRKQHRQQMSAEHVARAFDPLWEYVQQTLSLGFLYAFARVQDSAKKPQCGLSGKTPLKSGKRLVYQSYTHIYTHILNTAAWERDTCSPCFITVNLTAIASGVNVRARAHTHTHEHTHEHTQTHAL